jgi:hypothetical protein
MNYTELSAAIRNYSETEEPDFITNIPVFVQGRRATHLQLSSAFISAQERY